MEKPYRYDEWKQYQLSTGNSIDILRTYNECVDQYIKDSTQSKLNILLNAKQYIEYYIHESDNISVKEN